MKINEILKKEYEGRDFELYTHNKTVKVRVVKSSCTGEYDLRLVDKNGSLMSFISEKYMLSRIVSAEYTLVENIVKFDKALEAYLKGAKIYSLATNTCHLKNDYSEITLQEIDGMWIILI